ncbi:hypothetical protein N7493_001539 [Penicillium malachiteum]|uniref:Ubiquitin-conjugating enzyme E2C-binding protein n=1 Tax=Penicillium malachiteum TaxID=1324776 RepID=A0AAD6HUX8_9EURO|nr:hypothetical protein N7493_001539 [Penicillium malachiteum]
MSHDFSQASQLSADVSYYLYSELLLNIRQVSLYLSYNKPSTLVTLCPELQVLKSRSEINFSLPEYFPHATRIIKLPARVSDATPQVFVLNEPLSTTDRSEGQSHEYSFRMQIDPTDPVLMPKEQLIDNHVPWTATDMSISTRIRCRACGSPFLSTSTSHNIGLHDQDSSLGWIWKDLPSGNWAEMMDFWHCHKPDPRDNDQSPEGRAVSKSDEQVAQAKGYGAASHIKAVTGIIFIDVTSFILAASDCIGLQKGGDESEEPNPCTGIAQQFTLHCTTCDSPVGMQDSSVNGWRLMKANVSLNTHGLKDDLDGDQWQSHSSEILAAAQLLELIQRENARRFIVHAGLKNGLLLWVFSPNLYYSYSNGIRSIGPQQAMKVLFQTVDDIDPFLMDDTGTPSLALEEVIFPAMGFQAVSDALLRSNSILPLSARRFNEWNVGLLDLFSRDGIIAT